MKIKIITVILLLVGAQVILLKKTLDYAQGDYTGYIVVTILVVLFTALFLKGFRWAKWACAGFLFLLAATSVAGAVQHDDTLFYIIAAMHLTAAFQVATTNFAEQSS
jgi:hypothetical protein